MKRLALGLCFLVFLSPPALAHSAARGFVLLLPTANVILGGAAAVLISFAVMMLVPHGALGRVFTWRAHLLPMPPVPLRFIAFLSLITVVALVAAGFWGSRDPLENPLPLAVWTLWWVVIVLLHPLFGNLWGGLNPLAALAFTRRRDVPAYWPALIIFAIFAWFQLVYAAPEDPTHLARMVTIYLVVSAAAMFMVGSAQWLTTGDPFAIFLRMLGASAPLQSHEKHLVMQVPGAGLLRLPALPTAGVLFVLFTLSSISFDAFSNTFLWLSSIGINPLDFPGRSLVSVQNTLGLAASFVLLAFAYYAATRGGLAAGRLVYALIPISIAFHFAHYLPDLLVNGQYLVLALNDPFGWDQNMLGMRGYQVTASFLNTAQGATAIYMLQTYAIVAGHIAGVVLAHAITEDLTASRPEALVIEGPLTALMVAYTALGLWMLSTPSIG